MARTTDDQASNQHDNEKVLMQLYRSGDELRLVKRPEWGVGHVTRVESVTREGARDQRVWVRFPKVGMKTILASVAEVERLNARADDDEEHTLVAREARHEGGWLGEIATNKPEEAMTMLPPRASDPFLSLRARVEFTLGLFRFDGSAASLVDWATAQSGLDDPLGRFNRHELEQFFKRWSYERDLHLRRLADLARRERESIDDLLAEAPPAARRILRSADVAR